MIKTRFIVAIGLLMTLACCSNSGTDQTPDPQPAHAADATRDGGITYRYKTGKYMRPTAGSSRYGASTSSPA